MGSIHVHILQSYTNKQKRGGKLALRYHNVVIHVESDQLPLVVKSPIINLNQRAFRDIISGGIRYTHLAKLRAILGYFSNR